MMMNVFSMREIMSETLSFATATNSSAEKQQNWCDSILIKVIKTYTIFVVL